MSQQDGEKQREDRKPKAVALLSGGLDSSLAVRIMLEQGVDVEAVAVKTPFCDFDCGKGCGHRVKEVADELGIKLKTVYFGEEYLNMLKNPKYGYGSGMNPCIDCRGMMYKAAKEHMKKTNADFIITGEVLLQRPMSQNNRALQIIEKETGMESKVLRPLSAKHLPATDAEKMGLIKRENMCDIKGRSRKGQLALAKHFGISDPPNAAGGCLLTDPSFSKRVKDIINHSKEVPTLNDVELLKVGRHFRITDGAKLVVGRNKDENEIIKALATDSDMIIEVKDYVGPTCILRSKNYDNSLLRTCAEIAARYSDAPKQEGSKVSLTSKDYTSEMKVTPADIEAIERLRI
ncbi:MAG: tRNA (5-methylaminomethyl-2-thiouridylate)-methyltransferase, partial [Thermoproteota archaeon]|nr:tRNA (5-methylaminomethyl-2-thiouridylate)-methyltransferase [Thermoproteota archaeon]